MDQEIVVYCQRCKAPEATVYKGWALLCPQCKEDSDEE